jgi:predicted dehydrogenase
MSRPVIRIGVIGAGGVACERHLPALVAIEGVQVVAIADRSLATGQDVAARFAVPNIAATGAELLARDDLDAVVIATWPDTHAQLSIAALQRGCHVLCQAPMARDVHEAKAMLAVADAHPDLVAMVSATRNRVPYDRYLRHALAAGLVGPITAVDVLTTCGDHARTELQWRDRADLAGKSLWSMTVYAESLNAWVGPYRTLSATAITPVRTKHDGSGQRREVDVPQVVMVQGLLENGAAAVEYHSGVVVDARTPNELITIHGLEGTLRYYIGQRSLQHARPGGLLIDVDVPADLRREWSAERDFVEAVVAARRGERWSKGSNADFRDGLGTMQKLDAIHLSAATGRAVDPGTL